jgi:simple sugar transport system permease protein
VTPGALPAWADRALLPLLNLALALLLSGGVVLLVGADPVAAVRAMVVGAVGSPEALGYTLFYATDLVFTGLAVAVAFHSGLFNIGAEGQATLGGLGVALVCMRFGAALPATLLVPLAIAASALFGAAWAYIPAWVQARRGGHVVISTIMFNAIAAALMVWLLAGPLIAPGQMSPETPAFPPGAALPSFDALLGARTPFNAASLWALACLTLVWVALFHTRWGYALRVMGASAEAARYAGLDAAQLAIQAMLLSGALAGGVALNEVMGAQHKLLLGFAGGAGYTGIAVALMGRNHPLGILLAALLFGALIQGGAEMAFDLPNVSADLVVVVQGLVILFTGALGGMLRPVLGRVLMRGAR